MLGRVYYLRHVANVVGGKEAMVLGRVYYLRHVANVVGGKEAMVVRSSLTCSRATPPSLVQ